MRSTTFSLYVGIFLKMGSTLYVKANVHGCRQTILYAIAEKMSAMPV